MNPIATSETTSRPKKVRTDPNAGTTTIDLTTPATTHKTNRSPTKSTIQAHEGATASLPTSLHPLVLHFGNKLILIRTKRITKENIAKCMTRESNYIPKFAKASEFKITLSKGASEDGERVSFLEQQIQQAKDTYESSLKNVIKECITLETTAIQSQENNTIYTLLPSIAEAINTLGGITSDVHQKVVLLHSSTLIAVSLPTRVPSLEIHSSPVTVLSIIWIQYPHPRSIHSPTPTHQQLNETQNYYYIQSPSNQIKTKDFKHSGRR